MEEMNEKKLWLNKSMKRMRKQESLKLTSTSNETITI